MIKDKDGRDAGHPDNFCNMHMDLRYPKGINFNLLLSCKQIHQEAGPLVYKLNTVKLGVRSGRLMEERYTARNNRLNVGAL